MRVAFVEDVLRFSIPLGITGVAALLREGGHEVQVFVGSDAGTVEDVARFAPDAAAFSVISGSHQGYDALGRALQARLGVPVIWGGPHATFFPEIIERPGVDAVCVGEGEEAMRALAD